MKIYVILLVFLVSLSSALAVDLTLVCTPSVAVNSPVNCDVSFSQSQSFINLEGILSIKIGTQDYSGSVLVSGVPSSDFEGNYVTATKKIVVGDFNKADGLPSVTKVLTFTFTPSTAGSYEVALSSIKAKDMNVKAITLTSDTLSSAVSVSAGCTPSCAGKQCGADGCGGQCTNTCAGTLTCDTVKGICVTGQCTNGATNYPDCNVCSGNNIYTPFNKYCSSCSKGTVAVNNVCVPATTSCSAAADWDVVWSACSVQCGSGTQTATITAKNGCTGTGGKPTATTQSCTGTVTCSSGQTCTNGQCQAGAGNGANALDDLKTNIGEEVKKEATIQNKDVSKAKEVNANLSLISKIAKLLRDFFGVN